MFCPECGKENKNENKYCVECGKELGNKKVATKAKNEKKTTIKGQEGTSVKEIILNYKQINAFQLLSIALIFSFVNLFAANIITQLGQDICMLSGTLVLIVESFMKKYPTKYKKLTWLYLILVIIIISVLRSSIR